MSKNEIETVGQQLNVSRETLDKLTLYVEILTRWQKKINLVSSKTINEVWRRHILDCGQIAPMTGGGNTKIMDAGSGAGLPGLIIAIIRAEKFGQDGAPITLVESDQRKCAFIIEAAHLCGVKVKVENKRLENMENIKPDIITARAIAPIEKIIHWTKNQHRKSLKYIMLKGRGADEELTRIENYPNIIVEKKQSISQNDGVIITIKSPDWLKLK